MPANPSSPVGGSGGGRVVAASYYTGSGSGSCGLGLGMTFAELNMGTALGGLKCGSFIAVTYKGKTITVKKTDIGAGGPGVNGVPRAIDLYIEAARALGFDFNAGIVLVQYRIVSGRGYKSSNPSAITRPGGSTNTSSILDSLMTTYEQALEQRKPYSLGGP